MRTRLLFASLAITAAATTGLTACGSSSDSGDSSADSSKADSKASSTDDYCKELKADKAYFESFESSDFSKLDEAFEKFHALAEDAPDAVAADWKTVDGGITTLETALKDAGIKMSDLPAIQKGQLPKGADPAKLQQLGTKLQSLGGEEFSKAGDAIEAHAKKECNLTLSSS